MPPLHELNKEELIARFGMLPHPEGGYYVETHRSSMNISTPHGERSASTGILFLLGRTDVSHLHRIKSEEMWHYYAGGSIVIFELVEETKSFRSTILGPNVLDGEVIQYVVPPNTWFGSYVHDQSAAYSLVGCTVAPGFDFEDFELAKREDLIAEFPNALDPINRLTINETNIDNLEKK